MALACLFVLGELSFKWANADAAEAELANQVTFHYGGRQGTYQISLNEYLYIAPNKEREHRTTSPVASADFLRQQSIELENRTGGTVWLVAYRQTTAIAPPTRHYITHQLLLSLEQDVEPTTIANAFGLTYMGRLEYSPGAHIFSCPVVGQNLVQLPAIDAAQGVISAEPVLAHDYEWLHIPNDPLFTNQWHLLNTGQQGATPGADVNITNAWEKYRGSNVLVAINDSGFDVDHPDLFANMNTNLAIDVSDDDQDVYPTAGNSGDFHGTAVAGVTAARGDNAEGVSGAAPAATIVPIRMEFPITDLDIADALLHENDIVQVHNNSWGTASYFNLAPLSTTLSNAFHSAMTFGRSGRGTIFVFAAGNSGANQDNVNYSGLTKEMTTLTVAALNDLGQRASYSTYGAATVISAPAGLDSTRPQGTSTTDLQGTNGYNSTFNFPLGDYTNQNYTANFNGTSSASPLASGVIALILEANPNLGWRDVQEIVMRSASVNDASHADWATNAAGFHYNHEYGAGLINADAATRLATNWVNLGIRTNVSLLLTNIGEAIPDLDPTGISRTFAVTNEDLRLEHVQLRVQIDSANNGSRGDLEVSLTSPSGMTSLLAEPHGDLNPGYDWTFSTVRNWGEMASGAPDATTNLWTVTVRDLQQAGSVSILESLELILHGSISNSVTLSLTNPPAIIEHPLSRAATKGSSVSFRVLANSALPLSYRWLFTDRNGATTVIETNRNFLEIDNINIENQGIYVAQVANKNGVVQSAPSTLFVNSPPEISTNGHPINTASAIGGNATFSVAATGAGPLLYQWRRDSIPIPSATSSTLSLTNLQAGDFATYDVVVRNTLASVISHPATLSTAQGITFGNFVSPLANNGTFQFGLTGSAGQTVRVDGTTDFTNWTPLATSVLSSGTATFSDTDAGSFTNSRFYRVVPLP